MYTYVRFRACPAPSRRSSKKPLDCQRRERGGPAQGPGRVPAPGPATRSACPRSAVAEIRAAGARTESRRCGSAGTVWPVEAEWPVDLVPELILDIGGPRIVISKGFESVMLRYACHRPVWIVAR